MVYGGNKNIIIQKTISELLCHLFLTCSSRHCVQLFQVKQIARLRKASTTTNQRRRSAILRPLSKTYEMPWIVVRSAKSSVVWRKAIFPLSFSLILVLTGNKMKEDYELKRPFIKHNSFGRLDHKR